MCSVWISKFTQEIPLPARRKSVSRGFGWRYVICHVSGRVTVGEGSQPRCCHGTLILHDQLSHTMADCKRCTIQVYELQQHQQTAPITDNGLHAVVGFATDHCHKMYFHATLHTVGAMSKRGQGKCVLQGRSKSDTYRVVVN